MPTKPDMKNPKSIQAAFGADNPPFSRYLFDDGNMLNKAENIFSSS
jgi:hypothetical protein